MSGSSTPIDLNHSSIVRRGYHHGRLKEALLAAARLLLKDRGAAGFSLADAAKLAGVSAAAPYRHFRDKEALLAEVAADGFALFGERLSAALRGGEHPRDGFAAMGKAYLAFAREQPGLYEAMFSWCSSTGKRAGAAPQAFQLVLGGIEHALGRETIPDDQVRSVATQVWAMSHGMAMLAAHGHLAAEVDADATLRHGLCTLLREARGASTPAITGDG